MSDDRRITLKGVIPVGGNVIVDTTHSLRSEMEVRHAIIDFWNLSLAGFAELWHDVGRPRADVWKVFVGYENQSEQCRLFFDSSYAYMMDIKASSIVLNNDHLETVDRDGIESFLDEILRCAGIGA